MSFEFLLILPGLIGLFIVSIGGMYVMFNEGKEPKGLFADILVGGQWMMAIGVIQFSLYAILCGQGIMHAY